MTLAVVAEHLISDRTTTLFEWTFAILVANFSVQLYRLVAQFATLVFDILKLSYGVDLFWPLTTDDLRPYSQYFITQNEIIYKLGESLVLTVSAFYGALCLLDYTVYGLAVYFFLFWIHGILLIVGFLFMRGE